MATLAEVEAQMPWGFHDAYLEALALDYLAGTVVLTLRVPVSVHQEMERRVRVSVTGLVFCSIDPPWDRDGEYEPLPDDGLLIDAADGPARGAERLPPLPAGTFLHHISVQNWNWRGMHIAGRAASLEWLGEAMPAIGERRALFPGDAVPDPE